MKRAIFVSVGTIAGLTATLRYTPDNPILNSSTDLALGVDTGVTSDQVTTPTSKVTPTVPAVVTSKQPSTATPAATSPTKKIQPKPTSTKKPKPKPTNTGAPTKAAPPKATKTPSVTPKPTKTATPTPTPTPTPTHTQEPAQTFTGTGAWAGGYGIVQVKITVVGGKMTAITPLSWPTGGTSSSISGYAIPLLEKAALAAQSSKVATIGGATYTSAAFRSTLASAMANAGL